MGARTRPQLRDCVNLEGPVHAFRVSINTAFRVPPTASNHQCMTGSQTGAVT